MLPCDRSRTLEPLTPTRIAKRPGLKRRRLAGVLPAAGELSRDVSVVAEMPRAKPCALRRAVYPPTEFIRTPLPSRAR